MRGRLPERLVQLVGVEIEDALHIAGRKMPGFDAGVSGQHGLQDEERFAGEVFSDFGALHHLPTLGLGVAIRRHGGRECM